MRYPNSPFGGVPARMVSGTFGPAHTLTISGGVATKDGNFKNILLAGEGGVADTLTSLAGYSEGDMVVIGPASGAVTITVQDGVNFNLQGVDFTMDDTNDSMILLNKGANTWKELSRAAN